MRIAVRIQRDIATLLAALTLLNVAALAQRADVRISNNDRGHRMLASARVQRASWNGECSAVVWGTTIRDEMNTLRIAMYAQLVRSGTPVGRAWRVGPAAGQLDTNVQIAPFDGGFLIVFVDHAPDWQSGIYGQILSPSGDSSVMSRAMLYLHGTPSLDTAGAMLIRRPNGEWFAVWRNNRCLRGIPLDRQMLPSDSARDVSAPDGVMVRLPLGDDEYLVENPKGKHRVFHASTAQLDPRTVIPLGESYSIATDGSVVTMSDSVLTEYGSLFDSNVVRRRFLPTPTLRVDTRNVVVRTGSAITVIAADESSGPDGFRMRLVRFRMDSFDAPLRIDTALIMPDTIPPMPRTAIVRADRVGRCDGGGIMRVDLGGQHVYHFDISPDGNVQPIARFAARECADRHFREVVRLASDSSSVVGLPVAGSMVALEAPLARGTPTQHTSPGIVAFDSVFICTWIDRDTLAWAVPAMWTGTGDVVHSLSPIRTPDYAPDIPARATQVSLQLRSDMMSTALCGQTVLTFFNAYAVSYYVEGHIWNGEMRERGINVVPSPVGWRSIDTAVVSTVLVNRLVGADVDGVVVAYLNDRYENRFDAFGNEGICWRLSPPSPRPDRLIPLGEKRALGLTSGRATVYGDGVQVASRELLRTGERHWEFGLVGSQWMRATWTSTDSTGLLLEVFNDEIERVAVATVRAGVAPADFCVVQRKRDSVLFLVFGGAHGVRMLALSPRLDLVADAIVSQWRDSVVQPAAAVIGDTVAVVWQDRRDGNWRIYGTTILVPDAGARVEARPVDRLSISPNPARDHITISAGGDGIRRVRISDAFGRCIHDVPCADGTRERVSLAHLANGLYYVVVSTGHETVTRSVVLLR